MRTIETKVYQFSELSDKAKEKAIEKFWDVNVDNNWWECTYDTINDLAKLCGISGFEISGFDLGRSRSIRLIGGITYCSLREFANSEPKEKGFKLLEELHDYAKSLLVPNLCPALNTAIATSYHKGCRFELGADYARAGREDTRVEETIDIDTESETMLDQCDKCATTCVDFLEEFQNMAFKLLEYEYDHLTSEEAIVETIEANEYEFTEDGKQFF